MISLANGAILSKENLPAPLQITLADCNIPNGISTRCPVLFFLSVVPDVALPSRLVVEMVKEGFSGGVPVFRSAVYIFDPAAIPGGGARWTPIQSGLSGFPVFARSYSAGGKPAQNYYVFNRIAPTTTRVEQIVNK